MRLEFDVMVGWYNVEFVHCSRVHAPSANPNAPDLLLWVAENHQALLELKPYLRDILLRLVLGVEQFTPAALLRASRREVPVLHEEHEQLRKQIPVPIPAKVPHPRNLLIEPCEDEETEARWFGRMAHLGLIDVQRNLGMNPHSPENETFRSLLRNLADIVPQLTDVPFRTRQAFAYLLEDAHRFPATAFENAALLGVRLIPKAKYKPGRAA